MKLKDNLKEKCRGKFTKWVLFMHDNAPAHRSLAAQKKLSYLGFQCLYHPPYSPDLTPSDYHLFTGLKKRLKGRHFSARRSLPPRRPGWTDSLQNNSKAWTGLPSNGHIIKPFLRPTEEYSHSTRTRHRVDALRTFTTPPHLLTSQVIPKFTCLPNRPRQTHSRIYVHPTSI